MNRMLVDAVRNGTGKAAMLNGRAMGGKTGTSQEFKDAWFVGYTRQLVAGVWLGNDEGVPMSKNITGGTLPAQIWKSFMERATAGQPVLALPGTDVTDRTATANETASDFDEVLAELFKGNPEGDGQN